MSKRIVVGVTGASGAPYLTRFIRVLVDAGVEVHLTVSTLGKRLLAEELGVSKVDATTLGISDQSALLVVHNNNDLGATIASGTFLHDGMVVLPCSSNTLQSYDPVHLHQYSSEAALKIGMELFLGCCNTWTMHVWQPS